MSARTLAVVLAGGRGTRLGGEMPKALAVCGGRTLLARALATCAALCERVLVVAPGELALGEIAVPRIADPQEGAGPLAAIVAGLGAEAFDEALVLAVDLPLLTSATLGALRGGASLLLPAPGGIPQPLAAWYTPQAFAALAAAYAAGERSVSRAVNALAPTLLRDAELAKLPGGLAAWLNVNTADELLLAERLLAASEAA